jgi:hypothetical protein
MTQMMLRESFPIVGVELGARMESTALSVIERVYVPASPGEAFNKVIYDTHHRRERLVASEKVMPQYRVRHLERRSPPVRYKGVAERVGELIQTVGDCLLVVDITRTGRPVAALIREAVEDVLEGTSEANHVKLCPITVTGIAGGVSHSPDMGYLVPRRDLVSAGLLLFEQDQLKIAEGLDLAGTLTEEFTNFKPKPDPKDDLEGWRLAKNDDLVLSVAIVMWAAGRFLRKVDSAPVGSLGAA